MFEDPVKLAELILAVLGAFSVIARFTPSQSDNNLLAFIWKVIDTVGLKKPN